MIENRRPLMMEHWQKIKLGDISEVIGGGTPSTKNYDFWNGDIPWLTPKDLSGYNFRYISKGERNITKLGLQNSSARMLPKETVLLTSRAPIGYVAIAENEVCTNQGFKSIVLKEGYCSEFFYYLLKNNIDYIVGMASGSTFAEISGTQVKNLEFTIPPLEVQRKIAGVLGALDDKIELNNKINQNLELQAQALFKSWFVDFEPFGGTMPEDWCQRKLEECTDEIIRGFTSKYVEKSNLINLNQKVNKGDHLEKQYYKFLDENILVPKEKYAKKKDILLNSLGQGTLGRIHFWYEKATNIVIDQHITIIRAKRGITVAEYLYLLLNSPKYKDYFEGCVTGTTGMLMLNISAVRNADIMLPPIGIQEKFASVTSPLYEKIEQNNQENEKLSALRDTLLPKLMSGEINVDNVDVYINTPD